MVKRKRNVGSEILTGLVELKRGERGGVVSVRRLVAVEPSSGNLFADIGRPEAEAAFAKAVARRVRLARTRSKAWSSGLELDFRRPDFAREFLQASVDEGMDLQLVLSAVVRAIGVRAFSAKASMPPATVRRAIDPRRVASLRTLNRLLLAFRLRLSLAPIIPSPE